MCERTVRSQTKQVLEIRGHAPRNQGRCGQGWCSARERKDRSGVCKSKWHVGPPNVATEPQASDRAGGEGGSLSGRTACYTALPTSLLNSGMAASHGTASPAAVFAAEILLNSWRE